MPRSTRWNAALLALLVLMAGTAVGADEESPFSAEQRAYWAFQPVSRPELPDVRNSDRVRTPIDRLLLSRLEAQGLTYSAPANKMELLRRAKFDLLGLPPTPEEIDAFLADDRPDAFEHLIDGFLSSPHYGERWGRIWLDLVRFAETAGFNADPARPLAYKYRDYVIRSFNNDTPYNRFVQEQIAGDELFPDNPAALIATAYNRLWPDESNASDVLLARQDALNDLTANVGAVFLGLSVGCAQCHDHKFDPILQTDFYQLQAFFAGIVLEDRVPVGSHAELENYASRRARWLEETEKVRTELHELEHPARIKASHIKRLKFPAIVLEAIDTPVEQRTAFQHQLAFWSERQIVVSEKRLLAEMSDDQKNRRTELRKQWEQLLKEKPEPPRQIDAMATVEIPSGPPPTYLLAGGNYENPQQELQPGFPVVLAGPGTNLAEIVPPREGTSGRRAALARWLTSPENPLTARVMVNRIWQGHFDRGLVENTNDFGTQTPPPSHPELLDWLASEFVRRGWSIKEMHRLIMNSEAYRQSTYRVSPGGERPAAVEIDPGNRLYWHYPRRRLPAESIRDAMLAISGKLSLEMFGPGVRPELPPNFSTREAWKVSEDPGDRHRRSIYIYMKRNLPYPLLQVFDFPDMHESCAKRAETTVAPQALMVLNSQMILDYARAFAGHLLQEHPSPDLSPLVENAYLLAYGRRPERDEVEAALTFASQQRQLLQTRLDAGEKVNAPIPKHEQIDPAQAAAVVDLCHVLLNTNEFLYLD